MTELVHSAGSQTLAGYAFTLDANGNRTHASVVEPKLPEQLINQAHSYSYQTASNRIINAQSGGGSVPYSYDNAGQLQSNGSTSFGFDYAHRLIQQGNSNYLYDGVGNRIQATRSGNITKYVYDAAGNLLAEANASNQITHYYIYGLSLLARVDPQPNALYVYHFDGTGHTVAITNDTRQVINTYAYDPYGRLMAEQAMISQPFKYAGQFGVQAEGSNLYYMRARYYDAETGKFISEDPIGFEGGLNLYAYVGGNPIMLVDPSGLAASEGGVGGFSVPAWARNPIGFAIFGLTYSQSLGDGTLTGNGMFNQAEPKPGVAGGEGAGKGFSDKVKQDARNESGGTCVFCGIKTSSEPGPTRSEIDHAIPKSRGGNNSLDNAQNTCRTCNRQKGATTTDEFLQ